MLRPEALPHQRHLRAAQSWQGAARTPDGPTIGSSLVNFRSHWNLKRFAPGISSAYRAVFMVHRATYEKLQGSPLRPVCRFH